MLIRRKIQWTSQPQYPVGIDWGNPLTKGLIFAWGGKSWANHPLVVASSNTSLLTAVSGKFGTGAVTTVQGAGLTFPDSTGTPFDGLTKFSIFSQFKTGSNVGLAVNLLLRGTPGQQGIAVRRVNWSGVEIMVGPATNWLQRSANWSVGFDAADTEYSTAIVWNGSDDFSAYDQKGDLLAAPTLGGTACSTAGTITQPVRIGDSYISGSGSGSVHTNYCWNRALSAAEVKSLIDKPLQIFAPQERKVLVSVAGGSITADANITQSGNTSDSGSILTISADSAITVSGDTSSSAALLSLSANSIQAQADNSLSADSLLSIAVDASLTSIGDTATSTAALSITTDAAVTQASNTSSSAALLSLSANSIQAQADNSLSADSLLSIAVDASLTSIGDTASSTAALSITTDAAITQASNTSTSDSVVVISADASATQDSNTVTSTATLASDSITANADITQAENTTTSAATLSLVGDASVTQGGNTATADGLISILASASVTQADNTITADALLASDTITANANITQADNSCSSSAVFAIDASLSISQADHISYSDSVLIIAAYADISQAGNSLVAAGGFNTWDGETFRRSSPIAMSRTFNSAIRKTITFNSAI